MTNNNGKLKIAAYCRVSTEKEEQLTSLETQKIFFEEYAVRNNFELVGLYADEGLSGTKLKNRKEFNRMMVDARLGKFECLFVKDVSRLARNVVDFLQSIRKLKALNIDCRFVTANMSTSDGELTLTILAAVAQEESANLSKRVKFGKRRNAEKGRVPNIVYGYDKKAGEYFTLKINETEAKVVKRIFYSYVNLRQGTNKIAQLLNKEGLTTKRGCRWSGQAVSTILTNRLYTGKVINGKESVRDFLTGERVKNSIEKQFTVDSPKLAIIENEIFDQAQILLTERSQNFGLTKKRQSGKYCFSTIIKCASCGYSFRRVYRKYVNEYLRWSCSGRNANGKNFCDNHSIIDEKELLGEIKNYLSGLASSEDKLLKKTIAELKKQYKPENFELSESYISSELTRLKKTRVKQLEMFEADAITLNELKDRTAELNALILKYQNRLDVVRENGLNAPVLSRIEDLAGKYSGGLRELLAADIIDNALLRKVIDKITVTAEGEIKVYLKMFPGLGNSYAAAN